MHVQAMLMLGPWGIIRFIKFGCACCIGSRLPQIIMKWYFGAQTSNILFSLELCIRSPKSSHSDASHSHRFVLIADVLMPAQYRRIKPSCLSCMKPNHKCVWITFNQFWINIRWMFFRVSSCMFMSRICLEHRTHTYHIHARSHTDP